MHEMQEAVVLAAGKASRAGDFKLGWAFGQDVVLRRCIRNLLPFCKQVHVVTGYRPERVTQLVAGMESVTTVHNPDFENGMFTSVQAGLAETRSDRVFITPGDIPMVCETVMQRLLAADTPVAIPTYLGKKGHPVLISAPVQEAVRSADPNGTLRAELDRFDQEFVPVACEGILLDIDTIADYNQLREFHEQHNP